MLGLLLIFSLSGALLICLSIPLIRRRVPPNNWYGFRVPATMSDADVWYDVNSFAAFRLLWVGVAMILVSIVGYFIPQITTDFYGAVVALVAILGLSIMLVQSFVFLRAIKSEVPTAKGRAQK